MATGTYVVNYHHQWVDKFCVRERPAWSAWLDGTGRWMLHNGEVRQAHLRAQQSLFCDWPECTSLNRNVGDASSPCLNACMNASTFGTPAYYTLYIPPSPTTWGVTKVCTAASTTIHGQRQPHCDKRGCSREFLLEGKATPTTTITRHPRLGAGAGLAPPRDCPAPWLTGTRRDWQHTGQATGDEKRQDQTAAHDTVGDQRDTQSIRER